jgi:tripartite-type tricarboxylate transporter receptor subunit TctC
VTAAVKSFVACLVLAAAAAAFAQDYPSRPLRIVIPAAPGGGPDLQVRQLGQKLAAILGQPVVAENKVGAGGALAAQAVAQAAPDGYTVLFASNIHLIQRLLAPAQAVDPIVEFAPVSNMVSTSTLLVVRADHAAKRVEDLVAAARRSPGKLNYGSGGVGTPSHLAGATFASLGGFAATHIPHKGTVEITLSLLRGDTDFAFPVATTALPQVRAGKLRALATTGARRTAELPDVPTLAEAMKSELAVQESWFGIWAPSKTPPDAVRTLHAAIAKALADPELRQQLEASGGVLAPSESPAAYAAFVRAEYLKWAEIVKLSAAKSD